MLENRFRLGQCLDTKDVVLKTVQGTYIPHVLSPLQVVLDVGRVVILKYVIHCLYHTMRCAGRVEILTIFVPCLYYLVI